MCLNSRPHYETRRPNSRVSRVISVLLIAQPGKYIKSETSGTIFVILSTFLLVTCFALILLFRFLLGRHKAAIDVFNECLKHSATDWEVVHNLGVCYYHLKNNDKAKQSLREALNISKNELTFMMLAKIFIKEGNNSAAIEILSKASEYENFTNIFLLFFNFIQF